MPVRLAKTITADMGTPPGEPNGTDTFPVRGASSLWVWIRSNHDDSDSLTLDIYFSPALDGPVVPSSAQDGFYIDDASTTPLTFTDSGDGRLLKYEVPDGSDRGYVRAHTTSGSTKSWHMLVGVGA